MKVSEITSHPKAPVGVFEQEGVRYEIVLPDADADYIQKKLLETGQPDELDVLQSMGQWIGEGDLVIDVGAHVGNHTMYLASVLRARVVAFEPDAHLCSALNDSLVRNSLQDRVSVQPIGIGKEKAFAQFDRSNPENLGAQSLELGEGDIEVASLDSLEFEAAVRMIRLDVEGVELEVLRGARECIQRDRPILYIECRDDSSFRQILNWAQTQSYTYWKTFDPKPTHLFLPAETVSLERWIDHLSAGNLIRVYPVIAKLEQGRKLGWQAPGAVNHLESDPEVEKIDKSSAESIAKALRKNLAAQTDVLDQRAAESQKELDEAQAYGRELESRLLAVLDSNTWKIMEPVRSVLRLVKGRKRQPPFRPILLDGKNLTVIESKSEQAKMDRTHKSNLARKSNAAARSPAELEAIANELEVERLRLKGDLQRIETSRSYLLGRSIISALRLDLPGAVGFAKKLFRRPGTVVEKPKRFKLRDSGPDSLVEILGLNPEMKARRGLTVLVIGQPAQSSSLKQIRLNRADAEATVLRYAGCDLLVNTCGLQDDYEWGNLFQPDDMALNRFFSKLLQICGANSMRCHIITEDARVFPLLSKFEQHVKIHSTENEYFASRVEG